MQIMLLIITNLLLRILTTTKDKMVMHKYMVVSKNYLLNTPSLVENTLRIIRVPDGHIMNMIMIVSAWNSGTCNIYDTELIEIKDWVAVENMELEDKTKFISSLNTTRSFVVEYQ